MSAVGLARVREWREARAARVAFAPDGVLWACSTAQELQVYEGDELVATAAAPGEVLGELTFSLDGGRVLVAPLAYAVAAREWAPRPPVLEALAVGLEPDAATGFAASAGAWAPDGSALAIYGEYRPPRGLPARGGWEGPSARLVLLEDGVPRVLWEGERSEPRSAIVVGSSVVASGGRAVDVRDRTSGRPLAVLGAFGAVARTLRLDAAEARLAAGAADGSVAAWDTSSWEEIARWRAHDGEVAGLAWRPGGDELATGGEDGVVRLWSGHGTPPAQLELGAPITGLAFHPSGGRLLAALAGPSGGVVAVDLS